MANDNKQDPKPDPKQEPGQDPKQEPGQDPKQDPKPVPYARFKEINDALRATQDQLAQIQAEQKKAEDDQLAEQEKWKELAERRAAELEAERLERLRLTVATAEGLPVEMAARLQGKDKAELQADAKRMLEFIKPAEGPGVPPKTSPGGQASKLDLENMSPEEIREKRDELWRQEFGP